MLSFAKQSLIRNIVARNDLDPEGSRVLWSRHAVAELVDENLDRRQVEFALQECVVIEDYPTTSRPLPDCLVLGKSGDSPFHAVVAIDEANDRILIVTVYVPSLERWRDDWRTRK